MPKPKERSSQNYERFHFKREKNIFIKICYIFSMEKTHEILVDRKSQIFLP